MMLDADFLVDLLRGRASAIRLFDEIEELGCGIPMTAFTEVWRGASRELGPERRQEIWSFLTMLGPVPLDLDITAAAIDLDGRLRDERRSLQLADLTIAATAQVHGVGLVSEDRAMQQVPGLKVRGWR